MSLVTAAVERLGTELSFLEGEIGDVLAESPDHVTIEFTSRGHVRSVLKAHASRVAYDREVLGFVTASSSLRPLLVWYQAISAQAPYLIVYQWVEGAALSSVDPDSIWRSVGVRIRQLHFEPTGLDMPHFAGQPGSWYPFCRSWLQEECRLAVSTGRLSVGASEELLSTGLARLDNDDEPELCFIHGDLHPDHVILVEGIDPVRFLDFGDSGLGDPAWDLITLSLWDPDRFAVILDAYRPSPKFAEHVEHVADSYRLIRHLNSARQLEARGLDPEPDMSRALRLI